MSNASRVTWQQVIASVQRMPGLERVSLGKIMDAVQTAAKDVGNQPWPWNYATSNVLVPAPYSDGTISIVNGTNLVTGTSTLWNSLGTGSDGLSITGWCIRFGNSNLDYRIVNVASDTSLTLTQPVNLSASLVNSGYTIYKDTYLYPADYILGSDVGLYQPLIRTRISKIPRSKFEAIMNAGLRSFSTNITQFYCAAEVGIAGATKYFQFRLAPPPSGPSELRLVYHSIANFFINQSMMQDQTDLPDGFDEIIALVAASKLYDVQKMPGESMQAKALAEGKIKLLKRAVSTDTIDDTSNPNIEVPDSSISQWGMTIQRMS